MQGLFGAINEKYHQLIDSHLFHHLPFFPESEMQWDKNLNPLFTLTCQQAPEKLQFTAQPVRNVV